MLKADLHIHTNGSHDAFNTPENIFKRAKEAGLAAISFNDHDVIINNQIGLELSQKYDINFIPAVEMSAAWDGKGVDTHGFFINGIGPSLATFIAEHTTAGVRKTGHYYIEELQKSGVDVSIPEYDEIFEESGGSGSPLVTLLMKKGFVRSIEEYREIFRDLVVDNAVCFNPTVPEVIHAIHEAGGVAVTAHPGGSVRFNSFRSGEDEIAKYAKAGLDGIEVFHRWHDDDDRKYYAEIAKAHGLFTTGGSDNHGKKTDPAIGSICCRWGKVKEQLLARTVKQEKNHETL